MEAPSWKHQLAVASFLAVLGGAVVRLLIPGALAPFVWGLFAVLMVFFLPYLWLRTAVGYVFGVIAGVAFGLAGHLGALPLVADGTLPVETLFIHIPGIVFALLLIAGSVLAWREG